MPRLFIKLTPRTDAVFSKTAATEGQHQSHNAPTGSAIWGYLIHSLNRLGKDAEVKKLVKPETIQISNCFPIIGGKMHFPRPNNLYAPKHDAEKFIDGQMNSSKICVGRENYEIAFPNVQSEAITKFLTPHDLSNVYKPQTGHRLRTAIENHKAKEGQLFGYESIAPNIDYVSVIDYEDEQLIKEALGNRIFLGKARLNGFGGGFDIEFLESFKLPQFPIPNGGKSLSLWCLSDLCLENEFGMPKIRPNASDFGFDGEFNAQKSEISVRRFAPWDRAEGGRSKEIVVIEAGSVLAFEHCVNIPKDFGNSPFGLHLNRGFGWVGIVPDGVPKAEIIQQKPYAAIIQNNPIAIWAKASADEHDFSNLLDAKIQAQENVEAWLREHKSHWPSRTQWSIVSNANRARLGKDALFAALKNDKPLDDDCWKDGGNNCLRHQLLEFIRNSSFSPQILRFAINEMVRFAKQSVGE